LSLSGALDQQHCLSRFIPESLRPLRRLVRRKELPTQRRDWPVREPSAEWPRMNDKNKNQNTPTQTLALTRFRALNFVEDLQRQGRALAAALREAASHPWPDENGDYYAVRTLEDWWYAY